MPRRLLSILMIFTFLCTSVPSAFIYGVAYAEEEGDIYDESASTGYVALKRGDRDGEDSANIVILQNKLIELGYLYDAADGVFGLNTESAVSAFQRSNGLEETGEVSPEMQELLYSGKPLVSAMDSTDPESVAYRVQDKLAMWGFLMDDPDGRIGAKTEEAIAAFQDYLSSYYWTVFPSPSPEPIATPAPGEPSGYADAAVAIDVPLKKEDTVEITEDILKYIDGDYNFEIYHETVSSGDSNLEVWRVQRRLYQLNYLPVVDGTYGADTERALLYFQKKNGLNQTAVADEATQRILFSNAAIKSEEFVCAYKLVVDVSEQRTYAYQWNGSNYGTCVREMICSTGLNDTPTPLGTYQAAGSTGTGEWYWFGAYNCYAKWAYRIVGGILFHSVIYSKGKKLNQTSVRKLGRKASHGCIRLKVEDAKWIYDTCPAGTTVVVQE